MRTTLITLTLAASIALAADAPKDVTYLKGTIEGFAQNEGARLALPDTKVMVLKTDTASVEIPYAAVTKSDRKVVPVVVENDPLYKVWSLHERLLPPAPKHELSFEYTNKSGATQTLTVEMDKGLADKVMANVDHAAERNKANAGAWWGDDYWKTKRNKDQWGGAGTVAARE